MLKMKLIIGNTGLVGKRMVEKEHFDHQFNTQNIDSFKNIAKDGDELFLSCLPATKWMVNKNPQNDMVNINNIINIISNIHFSKVTLISTIDVYDKSPLGSDEDTIPFFNDIGYGSNRYVFELMVRSLVSYNNLKIFRLPAIFDINIKKNILFDLINNNNLQNVCGNSTYQWYNLNNLHYDINLYSKKYPNENVINLFTEPIETKEIVSLFPHIKNLINYDNKPIIYDYKTKFGGYIDNKDNILQQIKKFIYEISFK